MIKVKPAPKIEQVGQLLGCTEAKPTKTTMAAVRLAIRRLHGNGKSPGNAKSILVTKKRGRPATGKAMTNAQRQAKFKALKKAISNG